MPTTKEKGWYIKASKNSLFSFSSSFQTASRRRGRFVLFFPVHPPSTKKKTYLQFSPPDIIYGVENYNLQSIVKNDGEKCDA
ncbi:hypothetical protein SLE2022_069710 [Rubroshorea leprosula]